MKRISLKRIMNEVHRLDPKLSKEDDGFKCAVVLMTALLATGPSIIKVSKFCGYSRTLVRRFATNLRANKIWGHKYICPSDWFDKETGGVAFWLDVSVGLGFVERVQEPK